jgi:hypothetical protein
VTYDLVLAHHPLVTALPFVVPAVLVVGLLGAVIWRDRREDRADR